MTGGVPNDAVDPGPDEPAGAGPHPPTPPTRRRLFWAALTLLGLLGGAFALTWYDEAFPVLSVDLRMTRGEALDSAARIAADAGWAPGDFRQAASFRQTDPEVQTYVELEGGGPDVFQTLVADGPFRPYVWEVRHFAEGEVAETRVRFTPEGRPYGFRERLPEALARPELTPEEARSLAEAEARTLWGVELDAYAPVESALETRPSGRVDHTFVYERQGAALANAPTRLRLVVAGDRLSELTHFVEVPEAFLRRWQEIRSGNLTLALLSNLIFLVGFLVVGGGVGTFFLLRRGWVVWRAPLAWGFAVAALMALGTLNQLPLSWMDYDTAVSRGTFFLQQVGAAVVYVVVGTPFLAFVFLAAESLGRRAFPRHPQQWRLASRGAANSDAVLGRTLGAYLWLGVDLGFVVAFYFVTSRLPGWWIPADTLIDPDLLATPFPWLMALSLSLFAAFWEESLFRAIPVAGAKLLGDRFGGTRAWILFAVVLQALVFAAAHANYPQQPAYARIAELFLPALLWGVFYLRFGLLPVILIHFLHNFSFFSLVLFTASDAGLWPDRLITLALMAAPLAFVLFARRGWGRVRDMHPAFRNGAWRPAEPGWAAGRGTAEGGSAPDRTLAERTVPARPLPDVVELRRRGRVSQRWLVPAGLLGAVVWAVFSDPRPDAPRLETPRAEALRVASEALEARGVVPAEWDAVAEVQSGPEPAARFVWEEVGEEVYRALLGSYLRPPQWRVRFVRFTGPVEARAEEWSVAVGPTGEVRELIHRLPEAAAGAALDEAEARVLAEAALEERLGVAPAALRPLSAEARQRPARRDWTFTFAATDPPALGEGEARVRVEIGGDEVLGVQRFVHVPESWEREERRRATRSQVVSLGSAGLLGLLLFGAVVVGIVVWSKGAFDVRAAAAVALVVVAAQAVGALNELPSSFAGFTTAEPVSAQLFALASGLLIVALVLAAGVGLLAGLAHTWLWRDPPTGGVKPVTAAGFAGFAVAGAVAALGTISGGPERPRWPAYGSADAWLPALQELVATVTAVVIVSAVLLLLVAAIDRWTDGWTRRRGEAAIVLAWLGVLVRGAAFELRGPLGGELIRWIGGGLLVGAALWLVHLLARRFGPAVVPVVAAVILATGRIETAFARPFPGSGAGVAAGVLAAFFAAGVWARALQRRRAPLSPPAP